MAAIRDVPRVLRQTGFLPFVKKVWREVSEDNVFTLASALAYSWLFAIFPFLIFLLSLVPLVMPDQWKTDAIKTVSDYVNTSLPDKAARTVTEVVDEVLGGDQTQKLGLLGIGLILTIWAASGGMATTMSALDTAYDVPTRRPFYRQRPLAVMLTVVVASLVISVLVLVPVGTLAVGLVERYGVTWATQIGLDPKWLAPITWAWNGIRFSLAFVLLFAVLAIVYQYGANRRRTFRFFTPGSVFCVAVWIVLAMTFRLYVDRFGKYEKTYGTVGGVAILLLFFYIDALVLLIGAEIDAEFDSVLRRGETTLPPGPNPPEPPAVEAS